jgi:HNH endonuclease/NUMOD4 motif
MWKTISSHPNYQINDKGEIKNSKTGKLLKPIINNCGYKLVCLSHNNVKRSGYIHRLLAEAFIETDLDTEISVVNHIDGNKTNNDLNNLEWVTRSDNTYHGKARVSQKGEKIAELYRILRDFSENDVEKVISYARDLR